jgi:hypothetical protein
LKRFGPTLRVDAAEAVDFQPQFFDLPLHLPLLLLDVCSVTPTRCNPAGRPVAGW